MKSVRGVILAAILASGCGGMDARSIEGGFDVSPAGKGGGLAWEGIASSQRQGMADNGISYHGGPVMLGTVHVYYVWYGDWSGNTATNILTDLAKSIGGSPYFEINTTYFSG